LFGDFRFALTASILVGVIPGVFLGARFARGTGAIFRSRRLNRPPGANTPDW
jgi:hypothetical protein